MSKFYSWLEQHIDGSWWYHPGYTFNTRKKAESDLQKATSWLGDRPTRIFEHDELLPQDFATYTFNFRVFEFGGTIQWPMKLRGQVSERK